MKFEKIYDNIWKISFEGECYYVSNRTKEEFVALINKKLSETMRIIDISFKGGNIYEAIVRIDNRTVSVLYEAPLCECEVIKTATYLFQQKEYNSYLEDTDWS